MADPDLLIRSMGHHMPAGYVAGITHQILAAGFEGVERVETKFKRYAFLRCSVPA
jgi:hypothetical protein